MDGWARPKTMEGITRNIETPAGTINLTFNYDKDTGRLREVIGVVGKAGTYASKQLIILCRSLSILLQTKISRTKLCHKISQNFIGIDWENPFSYKETFERKERKYTGYEDLIYQSVVKELRTRRLWKERQKELGEREKIN